MSVGRELSAYISGTRYSDIPRDVAEMAKRCFLDWLGVTLAGSKSELGPVVNDYLEISGKDGPATLLGSNQAYDLVNAAFANGIFSHALDLDDYHMSTVLHTTAPTLPAVVAAAESSGATGKDLLTAVVLALDTTLRIGKGVKRVHYNRGWHITATVGRFGAVAGVSKLLDLDPDTMIHALGIAATSAGGLRNVFGTMSKPFHAGKAAMDGMMACLLASKGLDSSSDIFEGKHGFFKLFTEDPDRDAITAQLGESFLLSEICFKTCPAPL